MNRDEIMNTQAGEELNKLISEFMGREEDWSNSISAAWEVVEKLGQTLHFSLVNDTRYEGYYVSFETLDGTIYDCDADTMPEAICKASLLSLLEDTP